MKYIEWEEDARNGENKKDRWIYQHSRMTNKMPAERKASKKTWENMPLGETPETLIRNTKAIRHTHSSSSQRPTRETVSWKSERLQVSKKQVTDMKGLKGICWWRDRRVWKGETQCQAWGLLFEKSYYQAEGTPLSVITLNQGLWAVGNIHWIVCTHMCTHTLGYLLTQGRIGTLLVLLRGAERGISWGQQEESSQNRNEQGTKRALNPTKIR